MCIEHAKQADLFALLLELLRHFKRDEATSRVSDEIIRPGGLHSSHRANIVGSHLNDVGGRILDVWLQAIDWLVWAEMASQWSESQDSAAQRMNQEEWSFLAALLDSHERVAGVRWLFAGDHLGELLHCGRAEEHREWQVYAEDRFELREHAHCQQRVTAHIEEVIVTADRRDAKRLFPHANQFALYCVEGRGGVGGILGSACPGRGGERQAMYLAAGGQWECWRG